MHFPHHPRSVYALVLLVAAAVGNDPALAASPSCAGNANCMETSSFIANISDFRTSVAGNDRVATATLRFQTVDAVGENHPLNARQRTFHRLDHR